MLARAGRAHRPAAAAAGQQGLAVRMPGAATRFRVLAVVLQDAAAVLLRQQLQPDFRLAHLQRLINPNPVRPSAKPMAKVPAGDRRKPHHTPVEGKRRRVLVRWHPHCNIDAAVDIGIHRHFFIYPPSLKRGRQSCDKGRISWLFNNCIKRIY